jgi:hypothetical protein
MPSDPERRARGKVFAAPDKKQIDISKARYFVTQTKI